MDLKDITVGESWACKFSTTTFLDEQGEPVQAKNLALGQQHPGMPGEYESLGVIKVRDLETKMVTVVDTKTQREFSVPWDNCWDVDTVEWVK